MTQLKPAEKSLPMGTTGSVLLLAKTLRIKQWTKNLLLFAGVIFARQLHIPAQLGRAAGGFVVFSLLSSSLYIFNDLRDLKSDRNHPRKKFRPLASGALAIKTGIIIMICAAVIGLLGAVRLGTPFLMATLAYVILTIAYTLYLKQIAIIDVMTIATGFVLRAVAGAVAVQVRISPWLLVCTMLLALFLGMTKRRQELALHGDNNSREVLTAYNLAFLDQAITIITAATLTGYFLYAFNAHSEWLLLTIPFVLYGIFRYLLLSRKDGVGEEPEQVLLSDPPFIINLALWIISSCLIIYLI